MPYPKASFRMSFEWPWMHDLVKHSMTRSIVRPFCDSWASCSFVYSGMERIVGLVLFITFAYSITTDTFWPHTLLDQSIYNSRTTLIYLSALSAHTGNERLWHHARYVTSITLLSFVHCLLLERIFFALSYSDYGQLFVQLGLLSTDGLVVLIRLRTVKI